MATRLANRMANIGRNMSDSIRPMLPDYLPVAWKIGLAFSLLLFVGMTLLGAWILNNQLTRMEAQADTFGQTLAHQLADSAREPLLADDSLNLKVLTHKLVESETLTGAAIFDRRELLREQAGAIPPDVMPSISGPSRRWLHQSEPMSTYFAAIRVGDLDAGFAAVTLSRAPIAVAQAQAQSAILIATLVMTAIAIVIAFALSRRLAQPIHDLVEATNAIRAGNLHHRIENRRNDEIGLLTKAYNNMANGLLEKDQVERVLSRFVSPSVARRMMADLDQVQLGGREAQATVIFADIAGFTQLTEYMAPDAVASLLNEYFDAITEATNFYRGTIDKYMGDCAMIVFGVPEDDSEHLFHGLCCAVMIQRLTQRLNQLRDQRGLPTVNFRVGINAGNVLAGNLGSHDRMQYTVVGDVVNLASRLSNLAGPGQIIIPESVLVDQNIASRIRTTPAGSMHVRGKSDAVVTFRLDGVHAHSETLMEQRIARFLGELDEASNG